ncbi:hypothetical protein [Anaerosphaera multitolerans]|uniref:Lipoprotein n=1 Tax=Anaerosphaera multitolerans TaxID=2487351 RepID=A0A437S9B1_9FIRM|nr:hypothetical protein [Anaerosphaera multitolerans]RVU55491.1 hypothetical protein EF514_01820 [Anaerosphaera multitolerans]
MKKSILTLFLTLTLIFTGCSTDISEYKGSMDEETKTEIQDLIVNYEVINSFTPAIELDRSDVKELEGKEYVRIKKGYGYNSYENYKSIVENTFVKEEAERILTFSNYPNEHFKAIGDYIYVEKEYSNFFKEHNSPSQIALDTFDTLFKSNELLIVSYRTVEKFFFSDSVSEPRYLSLVNQGGKYLVANQKNIDSLGIIADYEDNKLIREHFNLSEDSSFLITKSNRINFDGVKEFFLYRVYVYENSEFILTKAAKVSKEYTIGKRSNPIISIEDLTVVEGKVLNSVFTELYPEDDQVLLLVAYVKDSDDNLIEDAGINFSSYGSFNSSELREDSYIIIPKYLDENTYLEDGEITYCLNDFYNALYGNYNIVLKDVSSHFKTQDIKSAYKLPEEVKVIELKSFTDYLQNR